MPPPKPTKSAFTPDHSLGLVRHVVASALANRGALVSSPLFADVNSNYTYRYNAINSKLKSALQGFCRQFPGAEEVVKEEIAKLSSKASIEGGAARGKKRKAADVSAPNKKARKGTSEVDELAEEELEIKVEVEH
ncbi:uncharacterized protein LOC62_03G003609 [Vanrija pseudolonga]|uniref:Uncharacterized protein n=1 Tax=Vanrija pseudolonga TaxID=143232 RepID=A0AAF1BPZ6_9TREE|nr:hypothetical protein LOC62_03G003609 [Vanrija pseudolonga]